MKDFRIDARLLSVAKFVRQGAIFADIGTDHAYLPLALLKEGRIERAIASDINEGPLASARANAEEAGITEGIKFTLTDGAAALANEGITDIAIAGMGGELIADIVEKATFLKNPKTRLILQPMTRQGYLRRYLAGAGYAIESEDYSYSAGKYYLTLGAHDCGEAREIDEFEAELGRREFHQPMTEEKQAFFEKKRSSYKKIADGKREGGASSEPELSLYLYINEILGGESV